MNPYIIFIRIALFANGAFWAGLFWYAFQSPIGLNHILAASMIACVLTFAAFAAVSLVVADFKDELEMWQASDMTLHERWSKAKETNTDLGNKLFAAQIDLNSMSNTIRRSEELIKTYTLQHTALCDTLLVRNQRIKELEHATALCITEPAGSDQAGSTPSPQPEQGRPDADPTH